MTTYQLTAEQVRIENISHVYMNGKAVTLCDVYTCHERDSFVFSEQISLKGHIKRSSTIKKRICLL